MEALVKSNRIRAEAPAEGANCHCRAALSARFAKNWLGAGESRSADETEPSEFSCTRTLIRTVPRMVSRAFCETSGTTLCVTSGVEASESVTDAAEGLGREAATPVVAPVATSDAEPAGLAEGSLGDDAAARGCVSGAAALGGVEGAVTGADVGEDAELELAGAGLVRRGAVEAAEEDGRAGELRRIRGTISNARKSVAPAPITKNFNELLETLGSATRRGAAIVTFTLGKEDTGTREGGCVAAPGETGDNGTERGSTFASGVGLGEDETAATAIAAEACAATAKAG